MFAVSCNNGPEKETLSLSKDFKTMGVGTQYQLKIPKYMKKVASLNANASFQASNVFKETYCVVIDESKSEFVSSFRLLEKYDEDKNALENYAAAQLGFFGENLEIISKTETITTRINDTKALMLSIDTSSEEFPSDITYFLTFFEGKEHVYMLMIWTRKQKKVELSDTFNKIANSFQALN